MATKVNLPHPYITGLTPQQQREILRDFQSLDIPTEVTLPWIDLVTDGEAVGDGTTDDTAAFETAVSLALSENKPLLITPGYEFVIGEQIRDDASEFAGLHLFGLGWENSKIILTGRWRFGQSTGQPGPLTIEGINFTVNHTDVDIIRFNAVRFLLMQNCRTVQGINQPSTHGVRSDTGTTPETNQRFINNEFRAQASSGRAFYVNTNGAVVVGNEVSGTFDAGGTDLRVIGNRVTSWGGDFTPQDSVIADNEVVGTGTIFFGVSQSPTVGQNIIIGNRFEGNEVDLRVNNSLFVDNIYDSLINRGSGNQIDVSDHTHSVAHADTTGQTTDDHHTEDHASRHQIGGSDNFATHDGASLTDTSPASADTYEQWGTEETAFDNPGTKVRVLAEVYGSVDGTGAAATATATVKAQVSFDGGSTWVDGSEPQASVDVGGTAIVGSFVSAEDTPTGEIQVRAQIKSSDAAVTFEQGRIHAAWQGVAPFDPIAAASWFASYWAEGPEFVALGLTDTDPVSTLPDESGSNNLTQATGSAQPLLISSDASFNNQPTIRGDGTDDFLDSPDFSDLSQPWTVVAIGRVATNLETVFIWSDHTNSSQWFGELSGGEYRLAVGGGSIQGGTTDTDAHLFIATVDGASSTVEVDGTTVASGELPSGVLSAFRLFANQGGSFFMDGEFAFAGIKNGALTATEKADLESWASSHYGLTIS